MSDTRKIEFTREEATQLASMLLNIAKDRLSVSDTLRMFSHKIIDPFYDADLSICTALHDWIPVNFRDFCVCRTCQKTRPKTELERKLSGPW